MFTRPIRPLFRAAATCSTRVIGVVLTGLRLRWEEHGMPDPEAPGKRGFGTWLIERACKHELEGEVELIYTPEGLRCELVFPLR